MSFYANILKKGAIPKKFYSIIFNMKPNIVGYYLYVILQKRQNIGYIMSNLKSTYRGKKHFLVENREGIMLMNDIVNN
jgi:hypothetical protein